MVTSKHTVRNLFKGIAVLASWPYWCRSQTSIMQRRGSSMAMRPVHSFDGSTLRSYHDRNIPACVRHESLCKGWITPRDWEHEYVFYILVWQHHEERHAIGSTLLHTDAHCSQITNMKMLSRCIGNNFMHVASLVPNIYYWVYAYQRDP